MDDYPSLLPCDPDIFLHHFSNFVNFSNSRTSLCFPIRNEKNKAVFVIEVLTKDQPDTLKKFTAELEQLETIIYVLDMCQRELLEEMLSGNSNNQFGNVAFKLLF